MDVKISVVIPVYKVAIDLFRRCLDSLAAQPLQDIEFIVVSDGAPKELCDCVSEYRQRDGRFQLLYKEHEGVSLARNFGVDHANGEYVSFVDAD